MEAVLGTICGDWEHSSEVESNVSVCSSTAKLSITDLKHVIHLFLTISTSRLLLQGLLELIEFIDNILIEFHSLDINRSFLKWVSWDIVSLRCLRLGWRVIIKIIFRD